MACYCDAVVLSIVTFIKAEVEAKIKLQLPPLIGSVSGSPTSTTKAVSMFSSWQLSDYKCLRFINGNCLLFSGRWLLMSWNIYLCCELLLDIRSVCQVEKLFSCLRRWYEISGVFSQLRQRPWGEGRTFCMELPLDDFSYEISLNFHHNGHPFFHYDVPLYLVCVKE